MNYSSFTSKLELAYAPLSNHDFTIIKREDTVKQILKGSMLYAIGQRPILTFENITHSEEENLLHFEIHMQGSSVVLTCILPLNQDALDKDNLGVNAGFGFYDEEKAQHIFPLMGVDGIQFYDANNEFLLWISPDKFLHHYWNNLLQAVVQGDYRQFTDFFIHYVGKSTDQEVIDRLTGHYTLQEILSLAKPIVKNALPTHEIMLLIFRVVESFEINILDDNVDSFVEKLLGNNTPSLKTVALDVEKVLVNLLNPEYNHPTKRFPNYPKSKDGLYPYDYNRFAYQISDDITMTYKNIAIRGDIESGKADIIAIDANKTVEIISLVYFA